MQPFKDRPPLVRFETRAVEKRDAAANRTFVDVDFALVTPQGSKEVTEKVVSEWFEQLETAVRDDRFPLEWLNSFQLYYAKWKKGEEIPLNGYAIKNWPSASPAEIKILVDTGVFTVEDLAQANEQMMARIGMGARSLVQRAKDFLAAKTDQGPLVARLDAMQATMNRIELENRNLKDENIRLNGALQYQSNRSPAYAGQMPSANPQMGLDERLADAQARNPGPDVKSLVDEAIDTELGA